MDIRISKCAHVCQSSGRNFVHEEEIQSLVRVSEGVLTREDYARDAWHSELASGAFCVWSSKYYDPKVAEQASPEVFSPLRQAFYESVESEERVELAKAYLAAQLLRRQKAFRRIKESDETDGSTKITLYTDCIGERLIEVRDPNFTYAELDAARNALLDRLQVLESPECPPEKSEQENVDAETSDDNETEQ